MAIARRQRLTLEEFLALPEEEPALEFEDGKVTQKVSPKWTHGSLQGELVERFNRFGRPLKLAYAVPELRTTFGGASYVPDVAVFRWERIPRAAAGHPLEDVFIPPDIAVEIASPGQSRSALIQRCQWYVDHGVPVAALVIQRTRSVMLFRPGAAPRTLRGTDRIDLDDILPGFELTVRELFDSISLR
jgi:Uma2 family endonuclease